MDSKDADPDVNNVRSSMAGEVEILETKLRSLNLETPTELREASGSSVLSFTIIQNDIRTSLKNIETFIQGSQESQDSAELAKIHAILKKPLESNSQLDPLYCNENNVSSVMSYLKLLSEVCSPTLKDSSPEDVFWSRVLEPIANDIISYLNVQIFQKSFSALSSSAIKNSTENTSAETQSVQGSGFAFHHQLGILLKGVRTLLVYLKRAIVNLPKSSGNLNSSVTKILPVLSSLMDPLKTANNRTDFDIGLDIRCNIGVGICYSIYYLCYPNDTHIQEFFRTIFTPSLGPDPSSSKWSSNELMILQLASSDTNRIALAFGVLNTWLEQKHDQYLYFCIATSVLNIEHGVKEAVNLGSARVLEIWISKLARPSIPISVLTHVSTFFAPLEFFCFMYMPAHIDAVKNCCRNILSGLAQIYDRLDDEKIPCIGADLKSQTWVVTIVKTILDKLAHIKWIALACVVRSTKKSLVALDLDPMLPENLLTTQRTYKSAANDAYVALMSYHFEQISSLEKWEKTWIDPLFTTQLCKNSESDWPQKRSIISLILNSEKLKVAQFQVMIVPLLKNVLKRMNNREENRSPGSKLDQAQDDITEATLLAVETIKMAYELKITINASELSLKDVRDSSSAPQDSFRGLVPRSVLNNWLWNGNPQIRLAGLALLVETKKTSDVISKQDFDSLKMFYKYNLLSQNPAFRQQFLSYFKKLIRRLRDGESVAQRKKDVETVKSYKDFLRWIWKFLCEDEGLFDGANFARRCLSLECLSELTQMFSSGFEIFGLTASGNIKYLRWLTDTYENNKMAALEILMRMPMDEFDNDTFCSNLFNQALKLCKSIRPPDSVTGRYLMTLLIRKSSKHEKYSPLNILKSLYSELEILLKKTQSSSLIKVSSESPFYGCMRCIRMILESTNEYKEEEKSLEYRDYVAKLLKLCFQMDKILFPVLGSAAPEGFLPGLKDSDPEKNKQVVRSLAAQMLLVCAWRSMKEICLLMSDMCCWFVIEGESNIPSLKKNPPIMNPINYILTFDQVSAIGDHLLYLLKNLMHRGVFEQVFVGFKQLATRLWKSTAPKLSNLPEKWLQNAMDQEQISAKSITRRSAGLPFIFQALLSAESENEQFIQKWVERLMIFDEAPEMAPIRIHSMNVLRGLFRDASFSSAMMPFVPHGLKMAFRGLKSLDWTERNSGLMLYGAVMRRTFGAKLNLMNAPTFFRKFPQMYDFLLNELDVCIQLMWKRKGQQEILRKEKGSGEISSSIGLLTCDFTFHLLLLLSSFTTSVRVEDTHFKLADFIPKIRKCGESDDMEVRKLSAKALVPFLISREEKLELAKIILNDLSVDLHISQNQFHGLLLQFLSIISNLPSDSSVWLTASIASCFLSIILRKHSILSKSAPTVYEVILEILIKLHELKSVDENSVFKEALQSVEKSFKERFGNCYPRNIIPGLYVADKIVAKSAIKICTTELGMCAALERVYDYFIDTSIKSKPYTDQFLELMDNDGTIKSKFTGHLFSNNEARTESVIIIEAVIGNYLRRVESEFLKFPGTENEFYYLNFMAEVPPSIFESLETQLVHHLIQRMFQLCDYNNGKESTTLPIKSTAFLILGKVGFSDGIDILSSEDQTALCDMILQWSSSNMDDDLRFAVAKSFPSIPLTNIIKFSATNQAKLWSSILMLAQDDESSLRQLIGQKLSNTYCNGDIFCDRKSLELLVHIYVKEFLSHNHIYGLLIVIGLLVREDLEVEAKAADDETEDRLFDKSEMNMYFEHHILAKTIKTEMESSVLDDKGFLILSLDSSLMESQINFFQVLTNKTLDTNSLSNNVTIRSILNNTVKNAGIDNNSGTTDVIGGLDELTKSNSNVVKSFIGKFMQEFLNMIDKV